jgi:hypothetical protein
MRKSAKKTQCNLHPRAVVMEPVEMARMQTTARSIVLSQRLRIAGRITVKTNTKIVWKAHPV